VYIIYGYLYKVNRVIVRNAFFKPSVLFNKYTMQQSFNVVHSGEIWNQSQCLSHEHNVNSAIFQILQNAGFTAPGHPRIWKKDNHTVIVCLVDDIRSCNADYHKDLPYLYDTNTTIITDNYLTCPTQYRVIRLPTSFLGIYHYVPKNQDWWPKRDFSFAVNRIDQRRFMVMLELGLRVHLHHGYVNFNCYRPGDQAVADPSLVSKQQAQEYWLEHWNQASAEDQAQYQKSYELLVDQMPVRNYEIEHDAIFNRSYVNIITETYSSDNNVALSEKIFRALVTPAPWTVLSGRYTVAYLETLGFDTLSDLVMHNHYDRLIEVQDKTRIFIWKSLETAKELKTQDVDKIKARCQRAAAHNQQLLASMAAEWPSDFKTWLGDLTQTLSM
jgi:hypothetical protein